MKRIGGKSLVLYLINHLIWFSLWTSIKGGLISSLACFTSWFRTKGLSATTGNNLKACERQVFFFFFFFCLLTRFKANWWDPQCVPFWTFITVFYDIFNVHLHCLIVPIDHFSHGFYFLLALKLLIIFLYQIILWLQTHSVVLRFLNAGHVIQIIQMLLFTLVQNKKNYHPNCPDVASHSANKLLNNQ